MRWRVLIWSLLSIALVVMFWRGSHKENSPSSLAFDTFRPGVRNSPDAPAVNLASAGKPAASKGFNASRHRLTNTTKILKDLVEDPRAILLENAFLDTRAPLDPPIPAELRLPGDPGSYIVQSHGTPTDAFQQALVRAGARVVAYIPNNAYLVRAGAKTASILAQDSLVAAMVPYEPYYKIKASLMDAALSGTSTAGSEDFQTASPNLQLQLKVLLFNDDQHDALAQLTATGAQILTTDVSPFGTVIELRCPSQMLSHIARLPAVQELEPSCARVSANDLSRVRIGVTADSRTSSNYLGLTGSNVLINVNDLGVDTNYPDLMGRVAYDAPASGLDKDGHGTHVAGIIAGNGAQSVTVGEAPGSSLPPVPDEFRGLAPNARIFSVSVDTNSRPFVSDSYLQQTAANQKALISNNSWHYVNDTDYDLGAASYDAAVRDALPALPGAQPVLFVFSAGNAGQGVDDGTGGIPGTIQSPGTAKNAITVGALEQARFITNQVVSCSTNGATIVCHTNTPCLALTDSSNQVASFSSRGNVAPGIEGLSGRFKPDLVAPGTFIVSTRSTGWDQAAYYSSSNAFLNFSSDPQFVDVLSNLNAGLGPAYRFESGTSLAAADVCGVLALMQEFFEQRLFRTNSPALMKALLINGARSLASGYDLHSPSTNAQGWGVVQLPNCLTASLTNPAATNASLWLFDQSAVESLSTGQQRNRIISVSPAARALPFRITLVWTDPPGNPVAGLKLVNDLDLVVTNLETGEVFWGNDIPSGSSFNSPWQAGATPNLDRVNNVENVFLSPTLGSNYSVTVLGHRIGVNALTERPVGAMQDYALVISSGDGQVANALNVTDAPSGFIPVPFVTVITNNFGPANGDSGALLLGQRVGAFQPLPGTNTVLFPGSTNATITIGSSNQWHFYVFTNDTEFTNAVFLTFLTQPLTTIPTSAGSGGSASGQAPPTGADVDLYVSRDQNLTNLDPVVLVSADVSLGRSGAETIIYSNATPGLYYIGVKSESLQGAEYGLLADTSLEPFAQADAQGNESLRGFPEPMTTPRGTTAFPGTARVFFVSPDVMPVRRAILTNTMTYAALSDVQATLTHNSGSVVLLNYSPINPPSPQTFVFDDSAEGDVLNALPSAGPGSLRLFSGNDGSGQWMLTLTSTNSSATNQSSMLFLEQQQDPAAGLGENILAGACHEDFVSVPILATNLTATVTFGSGAGPVSMQIYPCGDSPSNCVSLLVSSTNPTGILTVDQTTQPPLNPGLYVVSTCNLGTDTVTVAIQANTLLGSTPPTTNLFASTNPAVIGDDSVSSSSLLVTNTAPIVSVEVGVRINHPRISDLVLSLVGPDGTRVLLDGGRGGASTKGMGTEAVFTNTTPVSFSGGPEAVTNVFETGETSGTISINYDFFALPDEMRVYYEDHLLFDSGMISFGGSTNISYGPGLSTSFEVVMNEGGNVQSNTAWFYSVTSTKLGPLYFTFTEDTNLTLTPIKFAPPPFTNLTVAPSGLSSGGIFYLPEESLAQFAGKNALGKWALEIWDNRAGATNPPPTLLSWQLALTFASTIPLPVLVAPAAAATNLLGPRQVQWYEIEVPNWVSFSTNSLWSSSQPVNLLFNPNTPPTGTNAGDMVIGTKSSTGTWVFRTNALPGLVPGSPYFLGIQNTNPATATVIFGVEFNVGTVTTLTSGVPVVNYNPGPLNYSDYYRYVVTTNAVRVQFEVNGPTNDVTLLAHKGTPLPNLGDYDYISENPGTNDELIVVYDYSRPVQLSPGEWFLSVVNVTGVPASYSILATEFPTYGTNIAVSEPAVGSNSICLTWSSLPGIHYFVQAKSTLTENSWTIVSPTITASDVTTTFCIPLPADFQYFRVSEGDVLVPALPIISSVSYSPVSIQLQWSAPTNQVFQVQWTRSLTPTDWRDFSAHVSSRSGTFLFSDDGTETGGLAAPRFYRLVQLP